MSVIAHAAAAYREATADFLEAARAVAPADLDRHHPAGWSARQIIHHVADVSALAYGRLVFLVALENPTIVAFDEDALAHSPVLGYTELPVDGALAITAALREKAAAVIERLSPQDLDRMGRHTERGTLSLAQWIDMDTRHAREHAQQVQRAPREEL